MAKPNYERMAQERQARQDAAVSTILSALDGLESEYEGINVLYRVSQLRDKTEGSDHPRYWEAYIPPPPYAWSYGRGYVCLKIRIVPNGWNQWSAAAVFVNIDDGSLGVYGPMRGSLEEAEEDFDRILALLQSHVEQHWWPSQEDFEKEVRGIGFYLDAS